MKKYRFRYSIWEMTKRLFSMAKSIRGYLVVSTLASIIGNMSHMGLMGFGALWILAVAGKVSGDPSVYMICAAVSGLLIAVCRYLEGVFSHIGAYGILAKLRVHLFECLDRVAPAYMVDRKKGDLLSIAVSDIETLEFFFAHMIGPMFTVILLPVTTLSIAAHYHPLYAAVLLPVYLIISILLPLAALKSGRALGAHYREDLGELKSLILESVYGIRDIQIFGHGEARSEKVMSQNEKVNRSAHALTMHRQVVSAAPNFFVYLARILIILTATLLAGKKLNDPVGTILISFIATSSFSSTFSLTSVVSNLLETYAAAERFFIIEDAEPTVKEKTLPTEIGEIQEVRFDNVTFHYPGTDADILKNCNAVIRKGETVGLVGESGVGKSTVFRLLLRFYPPSEGRILLNGVDLQNTSFQELRGRIAMLEQDTYLFDCSIADNIAISKPGADMSEIRKAARRAGIADFIETLPDGYDTQMGQMSARLSGGERQRIGIARIMLAQPDLVVMDEPTSSLDVLHEKELLQTLKREYEDTTVLLISHRMSTLSDCDRILKLENGQLSETD